MSQPDFILTSPGTFATATHFPLNAPAGFPSQHDPISTRPDPIASHPAGFTSATRLIPTRTNSVRIRTDAKMERGDRALPRRPIPALAITNIRSAQPHLKTEPRGPANHHQIPASVIKSLRSLGLPTTGSGLRAQGSGLTQSPSLSPPASAPRTYPPHPASCTRSASPEFR